MWLNLSKRFYHKNVFSEIQIYKINVKTLFSTKNQNRNFRLLNPVIKKMFRKIKSLNYQHQYGFHKSFCE